VKALATIAAGAALLVGALIGAAFVIVWLDQPQDEFSWSDYCGYTP
jgi:hypothetical protein